MKVLVVDNNPVLLKAIATLVEREGCSVRAVDNGLQALEILKTVAIDIIFTDLVMPLVGGDQLCRIIRQTPALQHMFIVIISAMPAAEAERLMAATPCDLSIAKGSLAEMRSSIRQALEQFRHRFGESAWGPRMHESLPDEPQPDGQSIAGEILAEKIHREEIVACLSEGVIELNAQGTVVEVNRAALHILGLGIAEVVGVDVDQLGWGEHAAAVAQWVHRELRAKGMTGLTIGDDRPIRRGGKVLTMTLLAVAGASHFGICIVRDITRQYRAEQYQQKMDQALRLVKKMDALSGMAGGVAHDFNNLLAVMCGALDVALFAVEDEDLRLAKEKVVQAKLSAQSAVELVRRISQSSSYGIIDRERTELGAFLRSAVTTYPGGMPVSVSYSVADQPEMEMVLLDRQQMTTAIHNLLQNSVEAGSREILVRIEPCRIEQALVSSGHYVPVGNYVQVDVIDDGSGIESRHITEIFDPYFSTKERGVAKGMGLGLAVVYSTLRNHGGYVVVTSEWGHWTRVSLYLPVAKLSDGPSSEPATPAGMNVLLVEQDEQAGMVATAMLEYLGVTVFPVETTERAHALCHRLVEQKERLVGALINLESDEDPKAIALCQQVRAEHPEAVIIATGGSPLGPVMTDSRRYGFSNALPKPYGLDDLRSLLASVKRS